MYKAHLDNLFMQGFIPFTFSSIDVDNSTHNITICKLDGEDSINYIYQHNPQSEKELKKATRRTAWFYNHFHPNTVFGDEVCGYRGIEGFFVINIFLDDDTHPIRGSATKIIIPGNEIYVDEFIEKNIGKLFYITHVDGPAMIIFDD